MIVGATETPDQSILKTADDLYRRRSLRRVYYSAFSPIPHADARLPGQSPPLVREHRLYQADWLIRFYGFDVDELLGGSTVNLDLDKDPKLAWALQNRHRFPIDLNRAPKSELLRVPGLGVRNVQRLVSLRRHQSIRIKDLKRLRVAWKRAAPFVCCTDHHPGGSLDSEKLPGRTVLKDQQLMLFDAKTSATTGQL